MIRGALLACFAIASLGCAGGVTKIKECRGSSYCSSNGRCYGSPAEGCEARDAADCLASHECKNMGECTLRKGRCERASDDDCRKHSACRLHGQCTFDEKKGCIAAKPWDCAESVACTDRGACQVDKDRCVVGSAEVCAATTPMTMFSCERPRRCERCARQLT